jgi:hypothetical protein
VQSIIAWGFARTPACAEATWRVPPSARSAASRPPPAGSSGNLPAASNSRNSTGATPGVDPCPPTPSRCCLANNTASRGRGRRPPVWSEFAKGKGMIHPLPPASRRRRELHPRDRDSTGKGREP